MIVFDQGQWVESCPQAAQPVDGRGLALWEHSHKENLLLPWIQTRRSACVATLVPGVLWWSSADRAVVLTGDIAEVQPPQRAQRTETRTCPRGSCCCWAGPPAAPGTSDMLPRRNVTSGWKEMGEWLRNELVGWMNIVLYISWASSGLAKTSTCALAWDLCVLLFHSIGINSSGWSICWQREDLS